MADALNVLTALAPTVVTKFIPILHESNAFLGEVNTNFEASNGGDAFADTGTTIQIAVSAPVAVTDITPSSINPNLVSLTPTKVPLTLSNFKSARFSITSKDLDAIDRGSDFQNVEMQEAMRALSYQINSDVSKNYKSYFGLVGTPGTTPFASTHLLLNNLRQTLNDQFAPPELRRVCILDSAAETNLLGVPNISQALQRGNANALTNADLGMLAGFNMKRDSNVPYHTAGTITTGLIAKASTVQAIGTTAIVCTTAASSGACALVVGDILLFAGDTQTYVVTAAATQASASTDVTVNVYPPKKVALAGSEAVTVKASRRANQAFNSQAATLAMRFPRNPVLAGNVTVPIRDPISGMPFMLSTMGGYWSGNIEIACLYGTCVQRPECGAVLAG